MVCPDGTTGSCWVTASSHYTQPTNGPVVGCTDAATFVTDVTVPDGTVFAARTGFNKTWRIKNSGTCTWTTHYKLVHAGGYLLDAIANNFPLPSNVAPGQTIDLTVSLVSPAAAGAYQSDWKLQNAQGQSFGIGANGRYAFTNLAANSYCLFGTDGTTTVSQSGLTLAANQQLTDVKMTWPPVWPQLTTITGLVYWVSPILMREYSLRKGSSGSNDNELVIQIVYLIEAW